MNRNRSPGDSRMIASNSGRRLRVGTDLPGDNVVVSSIIDARTGSRTNKHGRPTAGVSISASGIPPLDGPRRANASACGAMSEQHGQHGRGNESVPQKFVRLVGCHDPNARTERAARPPAAPRKP